MHNYVKERLVFCNEEDTDGRARVTRDEERVVPVQGRRRLSKNGPAM